MIWWLVKPAFDQRVIEVALTQWFVKIIDKSAALLISFIMLPISLTPRGGDFRITFHSPISSDASGIEIELHTPDLTSWCRDLKLCMHRFPRLSGTSEPNAGNFRYRFILLGGFLMLRCVSSLRTPRRWGLVRRWSFVLSGFVDPHDRDDTKIKPCWTTRFTASQRDLSSWIHYWFLAFGELRARGEVCV